MRVDAFLAQDENFCFGKRYRGHNAAHRSALAAARMVEHFQSLHYVENKRSWEDGPASEGKSRAKPKNLLEAVSRLPRRVWIHEKSLISEVACADLDSGL